MWGSLFKKSSLAAVVGVSLLSGRFANANPLAPGAGNPTPLAPDTFGAITGTVIETAQGTYSEFLGAGDPHNLSGSWTEEVVAGVPGLLSGLTFVYQFQDSSPANSTNFVENISASFFGPYATDVGFASSLNASSTLTGIAGSGFTIDPTGISRSGDGDVVNFLFPSTGKEIASGNHTSILVIETNANAYTAGSLGAVDSGNITVAAGTNDPIFLPPGPLGPTGTPGPGFAPLPSSAYAGMAILLGLGIVTKFGRRGSVAIS